MLPGILYLLGNQNFILQYFKRNACSSGPLLSLTHVLGHWPRQGRTSVQYISPACLICVST